MSSHECTLSSRRAASLSALYSVLWGHATKSVCYPWGHTPSGRQENALPANIPGDANLELPKHQSENEQDFVSLLQIVNEKKERFPQSGRCPERICDFPLLNYLKLLNQCSAN